MRRPPALAVYGRLTGALSPLAPALLRARAKRGKEDPARLGERLGRASAPRPPGSLVWLHGASVGEGLSLLPLIEALREREERGPPGRPRPKQTGDADEDVAGKKQADLEVRAPLALLVTSVTTTAAELLAQRLPAGVVHQYAPLDTPGAVAAFLDHWRPELAVFVESELWPNALLAAKARGTRLALVSARLSEKSARGWARAPRSARALLSAFDLVLTQDQPSAERLTALGARDDGWVNLKRVGKPLPVDAAALAEAQQRSAGRPVLLAASTHPCEDEVAVDAFAALVDADALLVIVPRHPVRGPDVVAMVRGRGLDCTLQSGGEHFGDARVHVADSLGELGLWMRLARAVFLGGGLATGVGGHNALEPARLGLPIASGPSVANWSKVFADLEGHQAITWTADAAALTSFWRAAVDGDPALAAQAERAHRVTAYDDGALEATVDKLLALLR